jgi:hypothetical protein
VFAVFEAFLHAPWMLAGLAVLAVPPIIHLLNRRRHDVVDWGAMQFLQVSEVVRRRLLLEEVLLMLLRMGLLAVLVLALAGPFLDVALPAGLGPRPSRDVVLVLDGSATMAAGDELGGPTPLEKAREWARSFVGELSAGDGVALLVAREQVEPVVGTLSSDLAGLRERLDRPVAAAGSAHWPEAVKHAYRVLAASQKRRREIILLGDGQKFGFADPDTIFRWELLVSELGLGRRDDPARPRLYAVNLAAGRSDTPPNYGLAPLSGTARWCRWTAR